MYHDTDPLRRPKVEVGQVWCDGQIDVTILEVNMEEHEVYRVGRDGTKSFFGDLALDGTPNNWFREWHLKTPAPSIPIQQSTAPEATDMMSFFKGTPSGYCPCNILRSQCEYHKG